MPRHVCSKKIEENDTILLILRAKCNETITIELHNGMEYSGILTNVVATDRLGKTIWLTLQHVTARTATGFIFLTPPSKPSTLLPLPPINQDLPAAYQLMQSKYELLRYIGNFDYSKFVPLSADQQSHIISHLRDQQLYDVDQFEKEGQYIGETQISIKNVAKLHFPPSVDLLKQTQGYVNRLHMLRRNELKGKGNRKDQVHAHIRSQLADIDFGVVGVDMVDDDVRQSSGNIDEVEHSEHNNGDDIEDDYADVYDFY